ncbi:hypothetical protein MLD38_018976 [Melastoma candidum]|uniref:Uncharacterized protein n=1 Tax=Melastoma candidum TaxID=119954 RepID=A0ACB9QVG1_9MYRT|nr:hypothetical protein MLD38_018976 [Melastoma candidum]
MSVSELIHEDPLIFAAADDRDAGEDALSLCDMPLYGDAADRSFSSEDVSTSYRDEFFEFSPLRDRPDQISRFPPASDSGEVMFCGKLIRSAPLPSSPYVGARMERAVKRNRKGVAKKARVMAYSSPRSDKWYMMAFGMARFPSEMALSEIRRRQGKGNLGGGSGHRLDSGEMVVGGKKGGSSWGMMMKALGCSRRRDGEAVVVKASYGCIPGL